MKGIILACGTGSSLYPLTKVTNKHQLPVYDTDTVGCYPTALAVSGCRVRDYNNFINIFRPEPDTCKNAFRTRFYRIYNISKYFFKTLINTD